MLAGRAMTSRGVAARRLLHSKVLASNRHRAAIGQRLGLRVSELAALTYMADRGSLTPSELGESLLLTSGGVTALVGRLERSGFVQRSANPRDGRSSVLRPRAGILNQVAELSAPLVAALDREIDALSGVDRGVVEGFLARVVVATEREADALLEPQPAPPTDMVEPAAGLWT